jgi:hypothetical protein
MTKRTSFRLRALRQEKPGWALQTGQRTRFAADSSAVVATSGASLQALGAPGLARHVELHWDVTSTAGQGDAFLVAACDGLEVLDYATDWPVPDQPIGFEAMAEDSLHYGDHGCSPPSTSAAWL